MPPSRLRKKASEGVAAIAGSETSTLQLSYRPPYDWDRLLAFLAARALTGIEHVTGRSYARTVQLGEAKGWVRVTQSTTKPALMVEFTHTLTPVLPALLARLRALFDLDARPDVIARHLGKDSRLSSAVRSHPGLRVPGAFNGFEIGVRAILGQQVTVKAATTIACRFVEAFGEPVVTPIAELRRLTPAPARVAGASVGDIARHGILAARARSILALAAVQGSGGLCLDAGAHHDPEATIRLLAELPGIGPWTAHYIVMRALRWPDAFPKEDIVVRNTLGGVTPREAEVLSEAWRPWRSYAVMHLWGMATPPTRNGSPHHRNRVQ
jgi:AraC family transcriptional regulator of adaptative response / DNA-3-methyladenine glycosylase II